MGRKTLFLGAIAVFVAGSATAGVAQDMTWLIIGRAVQGLGGGGLMITAQAIVADLVPPRQRAKYMAPMGAVFGLASVAGPLLGGWFTDSVGWRWAFWINLPLGVLAFAVAAFSLRLPRRDAKVAVDYLGITLMAAAVTCTVLVADWGGTDYAWTDPLILSLAAGAVGAWALFLYSQSRAASVCAVEVADDGAGLAEPDARRVFERFYRADSAERPVAGSGLGLAIAAGAAETNGGRLELDTRPGEGCTFRLLLPNEFVAVPLEREPPSRPKEFHR
ncbi:MFS transporter [Streptomyces sp. NPDC002643]